MIEKNELAKLILNPQTGKSFFEENRILSAATKDEFFVVEYQRDGISSEQKRVIETQIVEKLKNEIDPDKIIVKTVSNSQPTPASSQPAQLKAGHGPGVAQKRKVAGKREKLEVRMV